MESLGFVIKGAQLPPSSVETFRVDKWGLMMGADVINMWAHIWVAYISFAPHLLPQAAHYTKLAYKICVAENVTFKELYGEQYGLT